MLPLFNSPRYSSRPLVYRCIYCGQDLERKKHGGRNVNGIGIAAIMHVQGVTRRAPVEVESSHATIHASRILNSFLRGGHRDEGKPKNLCGTTTNNSANENGEWLHYSKAEWKRGGRTRRKVPQDFAGVRLVSEIITSSFTPSPHSSSPFCSFNSHPLAHSSSCILRGLRLTAFPGLISVARMT